MNICEGLCYALFATLATLIVGLPASIFACRKMSVGAFAGNVVPYKFPVLEMGLFILVLFGMELILSVWTIRRQKKQSLIEQMRAIEYPYGIDGATCAAPPFSPFLKEIFEMSERCNNSACFSVEN